MRRNPPLTRDQAAAILSLPINATPNQARSQFRRLARVHHPDVGGDAAMFRRVAEAYDVMAVPYIGPAVLPPAPPMGYVLRSGKNHKDQLHDLLELVRSGADPESIVVTVDSRLGPYTTTLIEVLVDMEDGRDYFSGPRPPAPRSVWEEDE